MKILNLLTLAVILLFGMSSNVQAQCSVSFTSANNNGNTVSLTATASSGVVNALYVWTINDYSNNTTHTLYGANPSFTFNGASSLGYHHACVTIYDSLTNCQATYCDTIFVSNNGNPCSGATANYQYYVDSITGAVHFYSSHNGFPSQGVSYSWNFGNGTSSTSANPTTQLSNGWHSVCLTVSDSNCTYTYCDSVWVGNNGNGNGNGNGTPCSTAVASFQYYVDSITGAVHFYSSHNGFSNQGVWYSWSFGNGTSSTSANPTTQLSNGWHSVCLTVSDSNCTYTYCDSVWVGNNGNGNGNGNGTPCSTAVASFQYYVDTVTGAVNFYSSHNGFSTPGVWYSWNFGNGTSSNAGNPTTQLSNGWHFVCLTVSDSNCTYTYCDSIWVGNNGNGNGNPCSGATANYQYYVDSITGVVHFYSSYNGFPNQGVSYSWSFGNGTSSNAANPTVQLPNGWHSVCLTVSDSNCTYTYCDSIYVWGINGGNPCNQNEVTLVINLDNYAYETSWDLTDANGAVVASGSGYSLNNTVITRTLCLPTGCYDFTIYDSYGDGICCAYGQGHYSLTETGSGANLASGGAFTYSESTNFCVGGASNPCGNFGNSYYTYSVGANGAVTFTPQITGNIYPMNYSWDFGNNNFSTASNPTFTFSANGYYLVCMTIDSAGCITTYCDTVFVNTNNNGNPTGPCSTLSVDINITQDSTNPFLLWMQPVVTGAAANAQFTFVWDFGDNTGGFSGSPTHMYNGFGSYVVCIMALDNTNGCVATFCDTITIDSSGNFSRNFTKPSFWVNTLPPVIHVYSGVDVVTTNGLAINLFPNPANSIVNLDITSEEAIDGAVSILDVTGKTVYNQTVNVAAGQQQVSLSVDQLPAGMYLVQLVSGNTQKTMKFIKE